MTVLETLGAVPAIRSFDALIAILARAVGAGAAAMDSDPRLKKNRRAARLR